MPSCSDKDEHIEEGDVERGKDKDAAPEVAARTLNRGRGAEGRTPSACEKK